MAIVAIIFNARKLFMCSASFNHLYGRPPINASTMDNHVGPNDEPNILILLLCFQGQ